MSRPDVTRLLDLVEAGETHAADALLPLVYDELRRLAESRLAREQRASIQATELVHEAYLRLVGPATGPQPSWDGRGHFFAAAAEAMRRILVDRARARRALKRGGDARQLPLDPALLTIDETPAEVVDLADSLDRLEAVDRQKALLVKLRFFAGLTLKDAALALGLSLTTAERHWTYSKAWLYKDLSAPPDGVALTLRTIRKVGGTGHHRSKAAPRNSRSSSARPSTGRR